MKVIENEYGKVPLIFKRMGERPEVLISHLLYKGTVAETSRLDPEVRGTDQHGGRGGLKMPGTARVTTCRQRPRWVQPGRRSLK